MRRRDLLGLAAGLSLLPAGVALAQQPTLSLAEQAFLDRLDSQGWKVGPRGPTRYRVIRSGPANGASPSVIDTASLHYQGRLENGTVFEDTRAAGKPVALQLTRTIGGWKQVVPLMRPGDVWELGVPASAAYGAAGSGSGKVPPGANLFFTIELLSFTRPRIGG